MWTGRLTLRQASVYIHALPSESQTVHSLIGANAEWTNSEHMLATLIDLSAESNWLYASAHSEGKGPERPKPIPRPTDKKDESEPVKFASAQEVSMFLSNLNRG